MQKIIWILAIFALALPSIAEAKKRPHVVIQKPLPPRPVQPIVHPVAALAFVAPPLLVFSDLNRRLNCLNPPDPLGLGGPGFDGKPTPPTNVMIPCHERRFYAGQPTPR